MNKYYADCLEKDINDLLDLISKLRLSMKAHPDYQTGRNQEFIDYVDIAEEKLEEFNYG